MGANMITALSPNETSITLSFAEEFKRYYGDLDFTVGCDRYRQLPRIRRYRVIAGRMLDSNDFYAAFQRELRRYINLPALGIDRYFDVIPCSKPNYNLLGITKDSRIMAVIPYVFVNSHLTPILPRWEHARVFVIDKDGIRILLNFNADAFSDPTRQV